jgi:hypothetical protein
MANTPQTVRLPMYDSDGMEVPGYLEVDINLFTSLSRMSVAYQNSLIVTPVEPPKPSVTDKTQRIELILGDVDGETVFIADGRTYPMTGLSKEDIEKLQGIIAAEPGKNTKEDNE